jgi:hypothetical protein
MFALPGSHAQGAIEANHFTVHVAIAHDVASQ